MAKILRILKGNFTVRRFLLLTVFMLSASGALNIGLVFMSDILNVPTVPEDFNDMSISALIFHAVICAPIIEELICRWLLFGLPLRLIFRRLRFGNWFALIMAIISTFIFALSHGTDIQVIYTLFIGMILCGVYYEFNTLLATLYSHALINSFAIFISYISMLLPDISKGAEYAVCLLLTFALMPIAVLTGVRLYKDFIKEKKQ